MIKSNFSWLLVVSPQGVSKNRLRFCREKFMVADQPGTIRIENSYTEKDFETLMYRKLTMNWQTVLVAWKANYILACPVMLQVENSGYPSL